MWFQCCKQHSKLRVPSNQLHYPRVDFTTIFLERPRFFELLTLFRELVTRFPELLFASTCTRGEAPAECPLHLISESGGRGIAGQYAATSLFPFHRKALRLMALLACGKHRETGMWKYKFCGVRRFVLVWVLQQPAQVEMQAKKIRSRFQEEK